MLHRNPVSGGRWATESSRCGCWLALYVVLLGVVGAAPAESPLVIDGLTVDGKQQSLPAAANHGPNRLRLPPGAHQLVLGYGPPTDAGPPLRLWYCLEAIDTEWREAGGEMRLTLMVFNAAGEVLGFFDSPMRGNSEGWSNTLAQSQFTLRRESVYLPPDTVSLRIIFNSGTWDTRDGASHPTVGLAVIDDCRMLMKDSSGQERNFWPNPNFDEGEALDRPSGRPSGWTRGGMSPTIAQVLTLPQGGQGHALALLDDNPRSGGEWRCDLDLKGLVQGGSSIMVEWKELFTVGAAGGHTTDYHYVPPGDYVFRVKAVTSTGQPTGIETSLAFSIPEFFWKTTPFLTFSGVCCAAVVAAATRAFARWRVKRQLEYLEQQRTLERERARIARDIHDDLGTSLTRVALLSQSVRGAVAPESPAAQELEQISRTSQEMTRAMEEIVWAVDPAHDSLDSIANYLGRFAQGFLSAAGVNCRLELPVQLPGQPVSAEVRHNLFLAFKEALNNVVRHSGAHKVNIILSVAGPHFMLSVEDDGKGFAPAPETGSQPARGGHGLANIRTRLAQIGGKAEVSSKPGQGTAVRLTVPLR
jgi:signal transduction histidine kinase